MLFQFGISVISWLSRKQTSVALSTTEAEYIATSIASREAVWLQSFLQDFIRDMMQKGAVKLQYTSTDEQIADILTKILSKAMDI
jgi:hypothetical protein